MQDNEEYKDFLFDISKEVKHFYETPVIFVTEKDYSDIVFNSLCGIRDAIQKDDKSRVLEIIVDFHLQWLHAVNDIETFKKVLENDFTRDKMYQAISSTIDTLTYRMKHYQAYIQANKNILNSVDQTNVQTDFEIIEDMHSDVTHILLERMKLIRQSRTEQEYRALAKEATDELLHWLDKICDCCSMTLSRHVNVHVPHLTEDLTKTLQVIVDELKNSQTESGQDPLKGKDIGSLIRSTAGHNLEISKVLDKISLLNDRIKRLTTSESDQPSAAVMALKHKKDFLEQRLSSLENLKTNLKNIQKNTSVSGEDVTEEELCICEDFFQLRIFNHSLPLECREKLVTELCYLWDTAIFGERSNKSMISILSAADMKEEFTDDIGTFYIDEHSRKIYKLSDDEETRYQLNEQNELVPVSDDADHIYFYDECGRYFLDPPTRQRVYKAHAVASEYMMDSTGVLLKVKEERDGVTYYYDNYGRYYINSEGKHIYRDADTASEYENDGLGNLVRIRSHLDLFDPCPEDAHVTEDFKYLKEHVGKALRLCIADVILHQPSDPIKYLSNCLIKYRENIELKDRRARENEELSVEREAYAAEERAAAEREALETALLMQGGSEASFDSNLVKYSTINPDDSSSVKPSSK